MTRIARRLTAVLGVGVGIVAGAALIVLGRVPGGSDVPTARVAFSADQSGELAVSPLEAVLVRDRLRPSTGEGPEGSVDVTNQTGAALLVTVRANPDSAELDDVLMVRIGVADRSLYTGSLGGLRDPGSDPFPLDAGATARLAISAWLPQGLDPDWAGRWADVRLKFPTTIREVDR
jgi:hypothetical protein